MKHINLVTMKTTERVNGHATIIDLPYNALPSNLELFGVNDAHMGNAAISEPTIETLVRKVKAKKNAYVICQGDNIETIGITDKRFDLDVHGNRLPRFDAQRDAFIEMFDKIGDRFLWILDGNHERKIANMLKPNADIAKEFNSVYANGTLVKAIFPGFRLLSWHGSGTINSYAGDAKQRATNEAIALKRKLRRLPGDDCEIITCGHYHKLRLHSPDPKLLLVSDNKTNTLAQYYSEPSRIWIDKAKGIYRVPEEERYYMCCGSYLKGYDENIPSYTEDWGLEATELGYGHIVVKDDKPIKVETVPLVSWSHTDGE